MEQLALFPRTTLLELPTTATADIYKYVQADNGRNYYLKLDRDGRYIRANEWICYRLANLVGVPTPRCDCIQTFNGDIAFGSEDIAGVSSKAETFLYLQSYSLNELGQPVPGLQSALTAIHVFDLFVKNVDRHTGNFLVTGRNDERHLVAVDFARSLFWDWPVTGYPSLSDSTGETWVALRERHGFDDAVAALVLGRLAAITVDHLSSVLNQMPAHWLPPDLQKALLAYCRDGGWLARVDAMRRGLDSGSIS